MHYKDHALHLLVLFLGLSVSFLFSYLYKYNPFYQFLSLSMGVLYYILWGICHHFIHHRLRFSIIMEYVSIGFFVVAMFALMFKIV